MNRDEVKSRRNVEIVRQLYDAFRRRDVVEIFSVFAPDIEIYQSDGSRRP